MGNNCAQCCNRSRAPLGQADDSLVVDITDWAARNRVELASSEIFNIPGLVKAYHTSVLVNGEEFVFSNSGVCHNKRLASHQNRSPEREEMGFSSRTGSQLLRDLTPFFGPGTYDLIVKNCNSFSDCALYHLLGFRLDSRFSAMERLGMHAGEELLHNFTGGTYTPNKNAVDFSVEDMIGYIDGLEDDDLSTTVEETMMAQTSSNSSFCLTPTMSAGSCRPNVVAAQQPGCVPRAGRTPLVYFSAEAPGSIPRNVCTIKDDGTSNKPTVTLMRNSNAPENTGKATPSARSPTSSLCYPNVVPAHSVCLTPQDLKRSASVCVPMGAVSYQLPKTSGFRNSTARVVKGETMLNKQSTHSTCKKYAEHTGPADTETQFVKPSSNHLPPIVSSGMHIKIGDLKHEGAPDGQNAQVLEHNPVESAWNVRLLNSSEVKSLGESERYLHQCDILSSLGSFSKYEVRVGVTAGN